MDNPDRQEKIYNLINLEEISGGSSEFIEQMIILFLDQADNTIKGMEKAMETGNIAEIRNLAHQLKPSVDNIRVEELGKSIRIVEDLAENQPNSSELPHYVSISMDQLRELVRQLKRDFSGLA
ncbi:MAG: Hpt domain-containing protein [Lunatimonas sp.]|uniref:Hpt domain-containing protein n=1 Tax=Lunatimonas sp. TaxID=2060141 RepID=UPI00263A6EA9|nr:Hpt domain-containing protein [Lunatimonas sp.]MCC5938555.1 Hpt domain-containing protein [Lunatimonas sp.]